MAKITSVIVLVAVVAAVQLQAAPIETLKLKFKLSARDLPDKDDIGNSDPYAEIFYTENNGKEEIRLGQTSTITDTENPDWGDTFEFEFVRSKRQRLTIRMFDEDNLREDDKLGQVYVEMIDFVDKLGHLTATLPKKGYIIVETVTPIVSPTSAPSSIQNTPTSVLPITPKVSQTTSSSSLNNTNLPMKLQFKLSAQDLANKDKTGASDPYVEVLYTEEGSSKQKKLAVSSTIQDNNNPVWKDVFEFQYDPSKNQKWFFEVRDSDDKGDSDGLGEVWVDIKDYIAKGQRITVNLVKTGYLTIESPSLASIKQQTPSPIKAPTPATTPTKAPVMKLRFKLSVSNVEDKDLLGTSDPYIKVYYQIGSAPETFIRNTQKFQDLETVDFPDVFEFDYDPTVASKFRFLVLDEDDNRTDDELGNVSTDVASYVKGGQDLTLNLKKGTLRIVKAY